MTQPTPPSADRTEEPQDQGGPAAAAATGEAAGQEAAQVRGWWRGTGRRKSAVARVRIRPGRGKFLVNTRPYEQYFTEERDRKDILSVLQRTRTAGALDIEVSVRGGGYTGQAGAIVLGLGRALLTYDAGLDQTLREGGILTRDPREVERKKYGQRGARRRFQFSKR